MPRAAVVEGNGQKADDGRRALDTAPATPPKVYQPRARRACLGELIQIDGSDHRWFEERAPACTLLVYVDDATSRLMMLHFTQTESTFSYFEATRAYIWKATSKAGTERRSAKAR